jgi:N-acetylmuramoyl-L-alanine amidase
LRGIASNWPRGRLLVALILVLALPPIDACDAAWHWPWQTKKEEKSKRAAAPKPRKARSEASKSEASKSEASKSAASKSAAVTCDPAKFKIVVDVGHTAESDGAMSARNVPEFAFNLKLAGRIAGQLKADGFAETTLLVTTGKAHPSLVKRVAAANNMQASLFLSIHHDSVPDKMLEDWEFEGKKSHFNDRFSGYSLFVSRGNADFETSLKIAKLIGRQLKAKGLRYADQYTLPVMGKYRHELLDKDVGVYRYDQLIVLMRTKMPAVLLEAGSIINRGEEVQMATKERQDLIVTSVVEALKTFCGMGPPPPAAAGSPTNEPSTNEPSGEPPPVAPGAPP